MKENHQQSFTKERRRFPRPLLLPHNYDGGGEARQNGIDGVLCLLFVVDLAFFPLFIHSFIRRVTQGEGTERGRRPVQKVGDISK